MEYRSSRLSQGYFKVGDMTDKLVILRGEEITPTFESDWVALFARAYQSTEDKGKLLIRKYKLNRSRLCLLYADGRMVGSYSGLELPFAGTRVFLSTDTMSDGTRRGASVIMGNHLYEELEREGFVAVCGYPNDKIRKLREKRLLWIIDGELALWVGLPALWRFGRRDPENDLWRLQRPEGGFFGRPILGMNLLGRKGLLRRGPGFAVTLASRSPGPFFVRVPSRLFSPRTFGYRFLAATPEQCEVFLDAVQRLDLETIDIP